MPVFTDDQVRMRFGHFDELTSSEFYRICQLRNAVFVVEQACPFQDLDGRDLEPEAIHIWFEENSTVLAYLRVLNNGPTKTIGRVVTHPDARGRGLGGKLMVEAIARCDNQPIEIHAQSYLEQWYARYGFQRTGPDFLEDDIAHAPMLRVPT